MNADTHLVLTGVGIPRFAARGIREDLSPVDFGETLRRNINGTLTDISEPTLHRKYSLTISGSDVRPMALDGVWVGKAVTVSCVSELGVISNFTAGSATAEIGRHPVSASGFAQLDESVTTDVVFSQASSGIWSATADLGGTQSGVGFIYYRPQLDCLVSRWNGDFDEWAGRPGWTMELQEV